MYTYIHTYIHACIHAFTYEGHSSCLAVKLLAACIHTYIHSYIHTYIHAYMQVHMRGTAAVLLSSCLQHVGDEELLSGVFNIIESRIGLDTFTEHLEQVCVCMYVCMYVCILFVCMHVCMYRIMLLDGMCHTHIHIHTYPQLIHSDSVTSAKRRDVASPWKPHNDDVLWAYAVCDSEFTSVAEKAHAGLQKCVFRIMGGGTLYVCGFMYL